jgi:hypothetical protein
VISICYAGLSIAVPRDDYLCSDLQRLQWACHQAAAAFEDLG